MMNQQPDKFFREKLEHFHKAPSHAAWERIEAAIQKKTVKKFEWWKIAAAVLLLAGVGYGLRNFRALPAEQTVSQKSIHNDASKTNELVEPKKNDEPQTPSVPTEQVAPSTAMKVNKKPTKVQKQTTESASSPDHPLLETEHTLAQHVTDTPEPEPNPTVETSAEPVKKLSSITLTISVEETNQYLDKNALAEATSEGRKSSTFKKLLKKASDLKSNQDPFGDLREKKNEILALNFKNEKRGQNK